MLKYVRELAEARRATPARRVYNYGMAAVLVAVGICVLGTGAPGWIFVSVVAAEAVFDFFLVNGWVMGWADNFFFYLSGLNRPPFANVDTLAGAEVLESPLLQPSLLARRGNLGALDPVARGAGCDEVLQGGRATLGPWIEVVTVFGLARASTMKDAFHFAPPGGTFQAFAALLPSEST